MNYLKIASAALAAFVLLNAGDAVLYNSAHGHGMIATGGEDCVFLAIILKKTEKK